ncbi:helix-turn-helix domain-containing protein [Chitinimonas sp. JJ19]|uniref:helix-turn-helix domain-containing protein n=1 Tax=Chitinimonas sp. JJ19 TaxID=3109352 RepID=UPI002FFE9B86
MYWHKMPSETTVGVLPKLTWSSDDELSPASSTIALMLYVVLHFMAQDELEEGPEGISLSARIATASYEDLMLATGGKSRSLISQGLRRLEQLKLLARLGSHQKRRYRLTCSQPGWFKLPCQAIMRAGVISPFENFTLRSRHELHALKVYLYLAARRDNNQGFSLASYENISEKTGVPKRHMHKALVMLTACGLLADINRERDTKGEGASYGPNRYYLTGHHQLFQSATGTSVTA